jgi:hypothetical protein
VIEKKFCAFSVWPIKNYDHNLFANLFNGQQEFCTENIKLQISDWVELWINPKDWLSSSVVQYVSKTLSPGKKHMA